jgi:hypothetical protein
MPAIHKINHKLKLIITTWTGVAVDHELSAALLKYQQDIKNQPDLRSYNEIVDFSEASSFKLTPEGITKLASIAAKRDVKGIKTKLAIIVCIPLAYGLGRMYEIYRSLVPNSFKEVGVFKNYQDALAWLNCGTDPDATCSSKD